MTYLRVLGGLAISAGWLARTDWQRVDPLNALCFVVLFLFIRSLWSVPA
jgi:hypothetical protein